MRAVALLLQGLGLHALVSDQAEYDGLRAEMDDLVRQLEQGLPGPEMLSVVGRALTRLNDYNRALENRFQCQTNELQAVISSLTGAVTGMVTASNASLRQLDAIREELAGATDAQDLQASRRRLDQCLRLIAREIEQHRTASASGLAAISELSVDLSQRLAQNSSQRLVDSLTGLPMRAAAEDALEKAEGINVPTVVVVCVLSRLKQINLRFGYHACNEMIQHCATHLKSGLNAELGFYRWSGPAFVGVLQRPAPFVKIKLEVHRLLTSGPAMEVVLNGRTMLMPNNISWSLLPAVPPVAKLAQQIDSFINSQSAEDAYVA